MRGRHCHLVTQRHDPQFDLFGPPGLASGARPEPTWRLLPDETRRAVTSLMVRLILEHGSADRRPGRRTSDDV